MTSPNDFEVVVVGAGQAGVSVSRSLGQRGIQHIVLERQVPFSAWRNRWDGFVANTPNWMNTLPWLSDRFPGGDPKTFATRDEMVAYLDESLAVVSPPIREGVTVLRVAEGPNGAWEIETSEGDYRAKSVVMCIGSMSAPRIPNVAVNLPHGVRQIHSSEYRNPEQIENGRVLVVGSASSGVQICRLLADSNRFAEVHLAASNVLVLPKSILGVQTHRFLHVLGFFDVRVRSLLGRIMYSGLETRGDPIMRPTPRELGKDYGVHLHGRLDSVQGNEVHFDDGSHLEVSDLTIIWCTGFRGGFEMIEVSDRGASFTEIGLPRHRRGVVSTAPGLFFVGLRYQHTVASHDIYGVAKDAEYIAERISRLRSERPGSRAGDLR